MMQTIGAMKCLLSAVYNELRSGLLQVTVDRSKPAKSWWFLEQDSSGLLSAGTEARLSLTTGASRGFSVRLHF